MKHTFARVALGAVITVTTLAAPLALAAPAQAATTHSTVSVATANKNLRNYTFMRDIYKTLDNVQTYYTTHTAAGIGSVTKVKTVHSAKVYKGSVTVSGTATVFTITAKNLTDHVTKRLRSDHGKLTYLNA